MVDVIPPMSIVTIQAKPGSAHKGKVGSLMWVNTLTNSLPIIILERK